MSCDSTAYDRGVSAHLSARVQTAAAELSALAARSRQPHDQRLLAMARADIECAAMRLTTVLDSLELEHLDHWLDMVEAQLGAVRAALAPVQGGRPRRIRDAARTLGSDRRAARWREEASPSSGHAQGATLPACP
jgi:hypothetical protein